MRNLETDVVIIGAGTAGLNARREIERAGKRWLMVEAGPYGTTCARVGCMPSKLLIAAADAAHEIPHAALFGIHVAAHAVRIDGPELMARVQRERDRFVGFVVDDCERLPAAQMLRGRARFIGPTTIAIDDHTTITTGATVIATGSVPTLPTAPSGLSGLGDRLLTNDTVFELPDLPRSLAVLGSGVIALELGQAMHRLGVPTTLLARGQSLAGLTDPKVRDKARAILARELDLRGDVTLVGAERDGDGVRLHWTTAAGATESGHFAYVLAATGRHAQVAGLGLEAIPGLAAGPHGVPLHDSETMQCGELPIFLAGDVAASRAVLHEAADEGRIAGRNAALFPHVSPGERRAALAITFTDPNIAQVGMHHADLHPGEHAIGEVSYDNQGRSRVAGRNAGLVRLYARRDTGALVGAEMVGPRVEHLAHLVAWAVQQRLSVDQALAMPFYHPVFEEGIRTGLQDLRRQLTT